MDKKNPAPKNENWEGGARVFEANRFEAGFLRETCTYTAVMFLRLSREILGDVSAGLGLSPGLV